ncbi:MAG: superoxide dismutase family protein [Parvibaculum sp.]
MPVRLPVIVFLAASFAAAGAAQAEPKLAAGQFKSTDGAEAGSADLSEGPDGVLIRIEVEGLAPGWHGVHFHATGDCSDAKFMSSGGHINHPLKSEEKPHGLLNREGPDFGDLPNLHVAEDGTGKAEMFSALVSFDGQDERSMLFDADGSAIVIHAGADDHMSQPIGGAGARVACAVLERE